MFSKIKGLHIDGRKSMSTGKPIENFLDPEAVYIPTAVGNTVYTMTVQPGDTVLKGQIIGNREGRFGHPIASPVSGTVSGLKKMWHSSGKMLQMLEIVNDHQEKCAYEAPKSFDYSREELVEIIKNAGIVGLGGAGFPTYVKCLPSNDADSVIINAAECEPFITADYMLLLSEADKVLKGLTYLMKANGAKKGYIAIKKTKPEAINAIKAALVDFPNIELFLLKDVYPAGWEKYIVEKVTHKTYSSLPREVGVVVDNVQSAYSVYEAVELNKPLIERIVTITGEGVKEPRNFRVKIGTRIPTLIEECGGYKEDMEDAYMIAGGPMTGRAILFDDLVVTPNLGSVIIMPKKIHLNNPTCMGCGKCAENCPSFLVPTEIKKAYLNKDVKALAALNANKCVQCGLCSYVCPSRIEMTDYVGKAKDMLMKANAVKAAKAKK